MGEAWNILWVVDTQAFSLLGRRGRLDRTQWARVSSYQDTQCILKSGEHGWGLRPGRGHRNRANVFVGGKAGEDRVAEALPLRGGRDTLGKAGEGERLRG